MVDIIETIQPFVEREQLLPEAGWVVVAVSGGADSLCLLHILTRLCGPGKPSPEVRLHVAHLDHQLRGEASAVEARQVGQLAASWGVSYTLGTADVPALAREERRSLEEVARETRYRFLRKVAREVAQHGTEVRIAIAHHRDDHVETLILHWLRGGGIESMIGLQPRQQQIIRPLLPVSHDDTLRYCQQHGLTPIEDASNTDTRFLRNRIRHDLLPMLETMNPNIRATLLRSAEVLQVDASWIEQQVVQRWPAVVLQESGDQARLDKRALSQLPLSLQRHLLRRVTTRLCAGQSPLELRHYKLIESLLNRPDTIEVKALHLPHGLRLSDEQGQIIFRKVGDHAPEPPLTVYKGQEVPLSIPGTIAVPGTNWIARAEPVETACSWALAALAREAWEEVWQLLPATRYTVYVDGDRIGSELTVRTRRPGDRLQPLGMASEKKVQDILIDKHIARSEREQIPLFFSTKHCIWLAGITLDDRVRLTRETQHIVRLSITMNER